MVSPSLLPAVLPVMKPKRAPCSAAKLKPTIEPPTVLQPLPNPLMIVCIVVEEEIPKYDIPAPMVPPASVPAFSAVLSRTTNLFVPQRGQAGIASFIKPPYIVQIKTTHMAGGSLVSAATQPQLAKAVMIDRTTIKVVLSGMVKIIFGVSY